MRYQNGLNRVLLLRANDLGFHATTTSAVSRRSARARRGGWLRICNEPFIGVPSVRRNANKVWRSTAAHSLVARWKSPDVVWSRDGLPDWSKH